MNTYLLFILYNLAAYQLSAGADQPIETERPHRQVEAQRVVIGETDSFGITEGTPSPEPAIAEDDQ